MPHRRLRQVERHNNGNRVGTVGTRTTLVQIRTTTTSLSPSQTSGGPFLKDSNDGATPSVHVDLHIRRQRVGSGIKMVAPSCTEIREQQASEGIGSQLLVRADA
jgi:hypothetical protein